MKQTFIDRLYGLDKRENRLLGLILSLEKRVLHLETDEENRAYMMTTDITDK